MTAVAQFERVRAVEDDHWWFVSLRELVVGSLASLQPGRVLDAGCGTGRLLAELPASWERIGTDTNEDVLALARREFPGSIAWVQADIGDLPFDDQSFDAVVSLDVLSDKRVEDVGAALRELRRVLRPTGRLVLNLPAYSWLMSGHDRVAQTGRRFTTRAVRRMLRSAGFEVQLVSYRVTGVFPLAALRRLASRRGATTDVGHLPARVNRFLMAVARIENRVLRHVRLPFGLSVFAVARPADPDPDPEPGGLAARIYRRALTHRRLVGVGQFAVTGERVPRRHQLLAEELARGDHEFVVDLGCGAAPLLRFVGPKRYVGIDEHEPSLAQARREHARPEREFVAASLLDVDLSQWRGASAVVVSSVCHHLPDRDVLELMDRIEREIAPGRILVQDAEPTGLLGPLVKALDDGDYLRPRDELMQLLSRHFETQLLWTYDNPLRSFHQFLLGLTPRTDRAA